MAVSLARRAPVLGPVTRHTVARKSLSTLSRAKELWGGRLVVSPEVEHALETSQAVVALETAIVTHGMPHPTNLQTALSLESIIRSKSAVPATIALLNGSVHVGLTRGQLEELADPDSQLASGAVKVSRRDLGPALALGKSGGTTVAGTMYIAESVGASVFVTGGIGGVHRGAENSMDISADLLELGRTPMAVVCAGAKSILDIPRTLEVLETQGVCVATYGPKSDFPAFYHPSSGCKSPWTVSDSAAAARLIHTSLTLPSPLSTLLAVPIPSEHTEAGTAVQEAVEQAVRESVEQGIDKRGKEVTPWLLKRVGELTKGSALHLNIKLIENNARVGADVAVRVAKLFRESQHAHASDSSYYSAGRVSNTAAAPHDDSSATGTTASISQPSRPHAGTGSTSTSTTSTGWLGSRPTLPLPPPAVLVFGSAAIDMTSTSPHPLAPGSTTPGSVFLSPGGVGRNIAEAAQNLLPRGSVQLISTYAMASSATSSASVTALTPSPALTEVGRTGMDSEEAEPDAIGKLLMVELASAGLRTDGLVPSRAEGRSTAVCSLTLQSDGDLIAGVADMSIIETLSEEDVVDAIQRHRPKMVVFDCNLLEGVVGALLRTCQAMQIPTFCDPTSTPKLPRLVPSLLALLPRPPSAARPLSHLSPNLIELDLLHSLLAESESADPSLSWEYINSLNLGAEWRAKVERFTSPPQRGWIRTEGVVQKMVGIMPFVGEFWVKAGPKGLVHLRIADRALDTKGSSRVDTIYQTLSGTHEGKYLVLTHHRAPEIRQDEIVSTTGAGDTLVGGLVAGLVKNEGEEVQWVGGALQRVERSLRSRRAVG